MSVQRLTKRSLQKILAGIVKEEITCVIKFYSNTCHYCQNLQEVFESVADKYEDVHFFAFNIDDYPAIQKVMKFNGVPTISLLKTGTRQPRIRLISEPKKPNKKSWYAQKEIEEFIEKEKQ